MGSFRIRFVLGLIALSLGHISVAVDTSSIFFRRYMEKPHFIDANVNETAKLMNDWNSDDWTVFLIHGFKENVESESVTTIMKNYLLKRSHNVIAIDYRQFAGNENSIVDAIHVNDVAEAIGNGLNQMVENNMNPDKIHIIGYSLGAQVAAHIGSHTTYDIPRITGLDPAGPLTYAGRFLKSGDALFVDIIHTDSGLFAQLHNTADVDFHPNGGLNRPQPGCRTSSLNKSQEQNCNHDRSWKYYAESVHKPHGFMAVQCLSALEFDLGNCNPGHAIPMGYATPSTARGKYYLHTKAEQPFYEGMNGIY